MSIWKVSDRVPETDVGNQALEQAMSCQIRVVVVLLDVTGVSLPVLESFIFLTSIPTA